MLSSWKAPRRCGVMNCSTVVRLRGALAGQFKVLASGSDERRDAGRGRVLRQDMVSTPGTERDSHIVEDEGLDEAQVVVNLGWLLAKIGEGGLVVKG